MKKGMEKEKTKKSKIKINCKKWKNAEKKEF